MGTALAPLAKK